MFKTILVEVDLIYDTCFVCQISRQQGKQGKTDCLLKKNNSQLVMQRRSMSFIKHL